MKPDPSVTDTRSLACPADEGGHIAGLRLLTEWVTPAEHDSLIVLIDEHRWSDELARRTQHYGFRYARRGGVVVQVHDVPALPAKIAALAERLAAEGHFLQSAAQVIVNEYQPGQGIAPHVDHDVFGPVAAILSLGDVYPMCFEHDRGDAVHFLLPRASLLVLEGEARTDWRHSIPARHVDPRLDGPRQRLRRISVTFRPG